MPGQLPSLPFGVTIVKALLPRGHGGESETFTSGLPELSLLELLLKSNGMLGWELNSRAILERQCHPQSGLDLQSNSSHRDRKRNCFHQNTDFRHKSPQESFFDVHTAHTINRQSTV